MLPIFPLLAQSTPRYKSCFHRVLYVQRWYVGITHTVVSQEEEMKLTPELEMGVLGFTLFDSQKPI
jgi:hypothetical protein